MIRPRFHLAFPVRHFGLILDLPRWRRLADRLTTVRFQGQPGEQATMFVLDPSGNALEFKALADHAMVFAK